MNITDIFSRAGVIALGAAAAVSFATATPAAAKDREVVIDIDDEGDLLERLIEMDAADIEEMRAEFQDAHDDIVESIADIEEARADVKGVPGGRLILKIAFAAARSGASESANAAIDEARLALDGAERELAVMDVSAEERAETGEAIDVIREGLVLVENALAQLFEAMTA